MSRFKMTLVIGLCGAFLCAGLTVCASLVEPWQSLFNGKDLSGWTAIDGPLSAWKVDDGLLCCDGASGKGWLSTKKQYDNFELELEFRLPPEANSGVFLRAPHEGDPAYTGMEIQVLDNDAPKYADLKPAQYCGSLYDVVAAKPGAAKKAGEWQKYQIVCQGRHVNVKLNGQKIVDANLDAFAAKEATHPGLKRKAGYIGLQNHGARVEFRNLRLRTLSQE